MFSMMATPKPFDATLGLGYYFIGFGISRASRFQPAILPSAPLFLLMLCVKADEGIWRCRRATPFRAGCRCCFPLDAAPVTPPSEHRRHPQRRGVRVLLTRTRRSASSSAKAHRRAVMPRAARTKETLIVLARRLAHFSPPIRGALISSRHVFAKETASLSLSAFTFF